MPFLSPYSVLWIVVWSIALFVVAPHLDVVCKPAARTVRLGSCALLLNPVLTFATMLGRFGGFEVMAVVGSLCTGLFWGSLALAAWQIVQGAPKRGEFR